MSCFLGPACRRRSQRGLRLGRRSPRRLRRAAARSCPARSCAPRHATRELTCSASRAYCRRRKRRTHGAAEHARGCAAQAHSSKRSRRNRTQPNQTKRENAGKNGRTRTEQARASGRKDARPPRGSSRRA
eukprot:2179946-Rhodomonas_salina.1